MPQHFSRYSPASACAYSTSAAYHFTTTLSSYIAWYAPSSLTFLPFHAQECHDCSVCVEIDGACQLCEAIESINLVMDHLSEGPHVVQMQLRNDTSGEWLFNATDAIPLDVVTPQV
jgi:hypothetical protein